MKSIILVKTCRNAVCYFFHDALWNYITNLYWNHILYQVIANLINNKRSLIKIHDCFVSLNIEMGENDELAENFCEIIAHVHQSDNPIVSGSIKISTVFIHQSNFKIILLGTFETTTTNSRRIPSTSTKTSAEKDDIPNFRTLESKRR